MSSGISVMSEVSENYDFPPHRDVTVKFQIDETQTVAQMYSIGTTVREIKCDVAQKFQIGVKFIILRQFEEELNDDLELHQAGRNEFGIVELQVDLTDDALENEVTLDPSVYYSQCALNDIISVHIPAEMTRNGCAKDVTVEIEKKSMIQKPYLGGYFNKETEIEYHNAFTQTGPSQEHIGRLKNKFTRDTQTKETAAVSLDTASEKVAQCFGDASPKIFISESQDYEICPSREYKTYDELLAEEAVHDKVRLIQRNWRWFLWRRLIRKAAAETRFLIAERSRQESEEKPVCAPGVQEETDGPRHVLNISKSNPKTKKDFDLLFAKVNSWKQNEILRINEQYSGVPKIAELNGLLDREIKLLNEIEQKRLALRQQLQAANTAKILDKLGKPVQWVGHKNQIIQMDTLQTQRARFLTAYYNALLEVKGVRSDERMSLLARLVPVIADECHSRVPELVELLEREYRMLQKGLTGVDVLRQRQNLLFFDIIRDTENRSRTKPKRQLCGKCGTVRPVEDFETQTGNNSNVCKFCASLNAPPEDKAVYLAILRSVRREERRRGAISSFAFILQDTDIKFIVEQIWHGHSILSQCDVKSELRLPRFNISEDWSPWNCCLLTANEARMHVKILDVSGVYEENILKDINNKLELGKSTFKQLREVDCSFVESGAWWSAGLEPDSQTI